MMSKILQFGANTGKKLSGAELYVHSFQFMSILPSIYLFAASSYPALMVRKGFLGFLCDLGMSCVPRAEAYGLSLLCRLTLSEPTSIIVMLIFALAFGLVMGKLLRGKEKSALAVRLVLAGLITADLFLRLLPFNFNYAFGSVPSVLGFVFRLACLALTAADVLAVKAGKTGFIGRRA